MEPYRKGHVVCDSIYMEWTMLERQKLAVLLLNSESNGGKKWKVTARGTTKSSKIRLIGDGCITLWMKIL